MKKQPGYIILLTLMILSISIIIVTQIFLQARLYNTFIPLSLEKERARQLAFSGVSIAISQLSLQDAHFEKKSEKKGEQEGDSKKKAIEHAKVLLKTLLTVQGRWQNFILKHESDGIDAQLSICITCEDGKLNINQLYDFEKHEFKKIAHASPGELFKQIGEHSKVFTNNKNLFETIQDFLKKQKNLLVDVTQLLQGKALESFKEYLFYVPAQGLIVDEGGMEKVKEQDNVSRLFLADLFTVSTDSYRITPWVLSPSLQLLLKIKPRTIAHEKEFEKELEDLIKKVMIDNVSWQKDWDTYLKPIYKIDFQSLPKELVPFLSTKFEPRQFSVLCYGKVGRVTQKLLVLLERVAADKGESFLIKKIYWL